jgi:hypothetical protein
VKVDTHMTPFLLDLDKIRVVKLRRGTNLKLEFSAPGPNSWGTTCQVGLLVPVHQTRHVVLKGRERRFITWEEVK